MRFDPAFFLIFPVLVLSVVVHECAHGLVAPPSSFVIDGPLRLAGTACLGLVGAPADGILP